MTAEGGGGVGGREGVKEEGRDRGGGVGRKEGERDGWEGRSKRGVGRKVGEREGWRGGGGAVGRKVGEREGWRESREGERRRKGGGREERLREIYSKPREDWYIHPCTCMV